MTYVLRGQQLLGPARSADTPFIIIIMDPMPAQSLAG